jgi:hypothetical protein
LSATEVPPAVARLYTRALGIECTVKELLAERAHMTEGEVGDLLAERAHIRGELSRLLGLGPQDLHPLDDRDFDPTWADDDPRAQAWLRAVELRFRLGEAMIEYISGGAWRP